MVERKLFPPLIALTENDYDDYEGMITDKNTEEEKWSENLEADGSDPKKIDLDLNHDVL